MGTKQGMLCAVHAPQSMHGDPIATSFVLYHI